MSTGTRTGIQYKYRTVLYPMMHVIGDDLASTKILLNSPQ